MHECVNTYAYLRSTFSPISTCFYEYLYCEDPLFGFYTVSTLIRKRKATFLYKLANSQNELCEVFEFIVREELILFLFV